MRDQAISDAPAVLQPRKTVVGFISTAVLFLCGILMITSGAHVPSGPDILMYSLGVLYIVVPWIMYYWAVNATYRLTASALVIQYGFKKYEIAYSEIVGVSAMNLKFHPYNTGWRLPGLALFKVVYWDTGYVHMAATALLWNILIIKTRDGRLYGITPRNSNAAGMILDKCESKTCS